MELARTHTHLKTVCRRLATPRPVLDAIAPNVFADGPPVPRLLDVLTREARARGDRDAFDHGASSRPRFYLLSLCSIFLTPDRRATPRRRWAVRRRGPATAALRCCGCKPRARVLLPPPAAIHELNITHITLHYITLHYPAAIHELEFVLHTLRRVLRRRRDGQRRDERGAGANRFSAQEVDRLQVISWNGTEWYGMESVNDTARRRSTGRRRVGRACCVFSHACQ